MAEATENLTSDEQMGSTGLDVTNLAPGKLATSEDMEIVRGIDGCAMASDRI